MSSKRLKKYLFTFGATLGVLGWVQVLYLQYRHLSDAQGKFRFHDMSLDRVAYTIDKRVDESTFDARALVQEKYFHCNHKSILVVGDEDGEDVHDPIETLRTELMRLSSCAVKVVGPAIKDSVKSLSDALHGKDVVLWWDWKCDIEKLRQVREKYPEQIWVMLNRDDPYTTSFSGQVHPFKNLYQIVFTSGSATLPSYLMAGVKEAHAFVPPADRSHVYVPNPKYECDVAFIGTNPYSDPGYQKNRTNILLALVEDAKKTGLNLAIYGTHSLALLAPELGEYFKGGIPKWENHLVWSNARISLNLHVLDGFGGWYVNERTTEILGSKGLLLVDPVVEGPFLNMSECIFLKSKEPDQVVKQIHEILDNYQFYEPLRERGQLFTQSHMRFGALVTRILEAVSRIAPLE